MQNAECSGRSKERRSRFIKEEAETRLRRCVSISSGEGVQVSVSFLQGKHRPMTHVVLRIIGKPMD